MQNEEIYERSKLNANTYRLISYTLVSLMIACAAATFVSLANGINPNFRPYYLIGLGFLVALDRLYTFRIFNTWLFLSREWNLLFATHAVVIIAVTKITVGLSHGWDAFLAEIPTWGTRLPFSFFDAETTFSLFLILLVWMVCGRFADLLETIGPDQIQTARLDLIGNDPKANIPARQRLIHLYFTVGAFLVIATMLGRINLRMDFPSTTYNPSIPVPVLAVGGLSTLLYFMLGLALLSQTQFISLHVRWNIQRIPISGRLARQWTVYSLLFLALIAALITLLPTSYGIRPLEMLGYALNMIVYLVLLAGQMIFIGLMSVLSLFFDKDSQQNPNALPPDMPTSPTADPNAPLLPDWLELIKGLIFWAVLIGAIVWAIRQYLRQNPQLLEKLRNLANWGWLANLWAWLRSLWAQVKTGIETVASIVRRPGSATTASHNRSDGFINPRRLDPRQKIYFFYLAFVRRAGEQKLPRSSHQTPGEYAATLQNTLPESAEDIQALTDAFVSARYSRRPVEVAQAHSAETIWSRLRKALRRPQPTDKKT